MSKPSIYVSVTALLSCMTGAAFAGLLSDNESTPKFASMYKSSGKQNSEDYENPRKQGHEMSEREMREGYNAPGRYQIRKRWGSYADISFLYWVPMPDKFSVGVDLEVATPFQDPNFPIVDTLTATPLTTKSRSFDVEYRPGFKVGYGLNFQHDSWTMDVHWIRLSGHTKDSSKERFPKFIIPAWVLQPLEGTAANEVEAKWQFLFNIVDFGFSRPSYIGTHLVLTPWIGVRYFYDHQRVRCACVMNTDKTTPGARSRFPVTAISKAETWQAGPRIGLGGNWLLGKGFRMAGDLALSVQYAQAEIDHEEVGIIRTTDPFSKALDSKEDVHSVRPNIDLGIGFGWGQYVENYKKHVDLSLKYDFTTFWSSNDITLASVAYDSTNITLHGFTGTFRLDF